MISDWNLIGFRYSISVILSTATGSAIPVVWDIALAATSICLQEDDRFLSYDPLSRLKLSGTTVHYSPNQLILNRYLGFLRLTAHAGF